MVLVTFLLAWVVRRRLDALNRWSADPVWRNWFRRGQVVRPGQEARITPGLLLVSGLALGAAGLEYLLRRYGLSLLCYPLELAGLLFLMGTPGWNPALQAYTRAWSRGDMQAAWRHIQGLLPAEERGAAVSPEAMHLALCRAMLVHVFDRFFLVAFWYVAGGLPLAIFARGLVALAEQWPQAAARPGFARLAGYVAWLPVRILSLTFGIAGDLGGWLRIARTRGWMAGEDTARVLMLSANAALTGYALDPARFSALHPDDWPRFADTSLAAVRGLLNRAMLVWMCGLALLVIAGLV